MVTFLRTFSHEGIFWPILLRVGVFANQVTVLYVAPSTSSQQDKQDTATCILPFNKGSTFNHELSQYRVGTNQETAILVSKLRLNNKLIKSETLVNKAGPFLLVYFTQ